MFSGLIEAPVTAVDLTASGQGARLVVSAPRLAPDAPAWEPRLGESLALSGCCLTLAELLPAGALAFDLSAETLALTWFDALRPGRVLNLERSLRLADRLGGHLVSGHVDTVGTIVAIADSGDGGRRFTFEVPAGFERYLVQKGSVAVDGISLTVVDPVGRRFDVAVIPETLERTSFGAAEVGQAVHLEADQIGKWVEHFVRERPRFPGAFPYEPPTPGPP